MKVRDRLAIAIVVALALAGTMWVVLVAPERSQVATVSSQLASERAALVTAEASVASARHAAAGYVSHLHQIDEVMRAVPQIPAEAEVVATIDKLTGAEVDPDFREIDVGSDNGTQSGPLALGLTFTFWTTYKGLQNFLTALDKLTATDGTNVNAAGRLFTVTSISLAPLLAPDLTKATISAQVYLQGAPTTGATGSSGPAVTG